MGSRFATNIVKAGFDLMVYDVRPEPVAELMKLGAKGGDSAREVASYADIVDIAVYDEAQLDAAMHGPEGLLAGAHPGLTFVIHSSVNPPYMQAIAKEIEKQGVDVLDAQMSGGAGGVESHTLCIMVGGDPKILARVRPVLETTAGNIYLMGGMGMGAVTKIAQNVLTAEYLMAASEGFRLAYTAGVDLEVFQEVVRTSAAQSHVADAFLHQRGASDLKWMYYHVLWDALTLGHEYDIELPGVATALQALANFKKIGT
jgi:3-hydroxyisobutyrate dehydrogenase-like beta-hydroxyacid dehydrogenase